MTATEFQVLGPLRVSRNEVELDVGSPKQRAVLALLLVNRDRPLSVDQMVDALWGHDPPPSAVATLQAYISNLRRILEPERPARAPSSLIRKNGGGYQIAVADEFLDSARFEQAVADAAGHDTPEQKRRSLNAALDEWRGPALADFRYEDFARPEIDRLEELRITAIELRAAADLDLGKGEDLVPELEQLVHTYPLRERLWGQLMVALFRADRQAEALRAYRRCESVLGEIGIVPGETLRQLELAVLNQDSSLLAAASPVVAASPPRRHLVGREHEMRSALAAIDQARNTGRGSVILIEGEAGLGKTRLVEAIREEVRQRGMAATLARCVEVGASPPFWPWIQITRRLGAERVVAAAGPYATYLAPVLPGKHDQAPALPLYHVAEALGVALAKLAEDRPLLVIIDDLASADPDSLAVLALLAAEIEDTPIVVLATLRPTDVGTAAAVTETLVELARLEWVRRWSLARWTQAEVGEVATALAGKPVDPAVAATIHERTDGNAFFTVELVKLLQSEAEGDGRDAATGMPSTVMEVIGRRLRTCTDATLALVRMAAIVGREFDLEIVADALAYDADMVAEAIGEAVGTGLIVETNLAGRYRFSHMIVVNAVVHELGGLRCAQLHAAVADSLERRGSGSADRSMEIAHHRVQAVPMAGRSVAIAALSRAGQDALDANAVGLAEELFRRRLELVMAEPAIPQRETLEMAALFDLGRVWTWREGFHSPKLADAADRLWELSGITTGCPRFDDSTPIDAMHPVLASFQARFSVSIVSGDVDGSVAISELLLDLSRRHPDPMVVYAANQTALTAYIHAGRVADALASAAQAESALLVLDPRRGNDLLLPLGQQPAWLTYHSFAAWVEWLAHAPNRVAEHLAAARRLCDESGNPFFAGFCAAIEGIVGAMASDPAAVLDTQSWIASYSLREQAGLLDEWIGLQGTWARGMAGGEPGAAAATMEEMLLRQQASGAEVSHTLYWALAAQLALAADDAATALRFADRGIARSHRVGERFWYPELQRYRSMALRSLGRSEEAAAAWDDGAAVANALDLVPLIARFDADGGQPAPIRSQVASKAAVRS